VRSWIRVQCVYVCVDDCCVEVNVFVLVFMCV